ncbi:MAG: AraC family transcriptional regulator [Lachnospiraceae bacterium]|nr:AraC family transcriptional regulator [Lachnospiraceae bacterium]
MRNIVMPTNQIYNYKMTGKFKALDETWKHEHFDLLDYELMVVTEGTLYMSYDGDQYTVNEGEYLLLHPTDQYRDGFKRAYSSFYWLHFTPDLKSLPIFAEDPIAPEDVRTYFTLPQQGKLQRPERIVVMMKQLQDIVKNNYPMLAINAATTCIITELYGQIVTDSGPSEKPADQKQIYLDIIDYIQLNINRNVTLSEIAMNFGYNPKYLSHLFAKIRGIPLKQFILQQKIDAANFLLADGDKTVTEISRELGFSDSHNFCRTYKKNTGLTPSEYRNAYSKRLLFHK